MPKDVFANYSNSDLHRIQKAIIDWDVMVDKHPELEKLYETYGADYEKLKRDIIDELKRRALSS